MQGRTISAVLAALALAGCGGAEATQSDLDAVVATVRGAAAAFADGDGDKTCGYLTEDAQRQAQLQLGRGPLGSTDCSTLVGRTSLLLSAEERDQLRNVAPANVQLDGSSASASVNAQRVAVNLNLEKDGDEWKISGFSDVQGG